MATMNEFKSVDLGGVRGNRFSVFIPRMGERIRCNGPQNARIPG